jgi:hypothetical protein
MLYIRYIIIFDVHNLSIVELRYTAISVGRRDYCPIIIKPTYLFFYCHKISKISGLHFYIDPSLIEPPADAPANEHIKDCKQKGAKWTWGNYLENGSVYIIK